jgi:hypothetical protein
MKAAVFEKLGLENLEIKQDVEQPKLTDHDVLIKVKMFIGEWTTLSICSLLSSSSTNATCCSGHKRNLSFGYPVLLVANLFHPVCHVAAKLFLNGDLLPCHVTVI